MGNNVLGVIGLVIASFILYIITSGSYKLSKQERIIVYVYVLVLCVICNRLIR